MNKVQKLFDDLVSQYNLRAIQIGDEVWYAMNDLPINNSSIRNRLSELQNLNVTLDCTQNFVKNNTKMIYNSDVTLNNTRNFNQVNNTGEKFGTFKMINFLVMSSRLGNEYKIQLINILDEIRKNDYYVDQNISDENYNKLVKELEQKSVWLRKCFGNTVVSINKVARDLDMSVDEIMTYMKKNKWVDSRGEITEIGGLGKLLLKDNKYYLGKRGISLICNAKCRQQNKLKVENSINKNGLNDIL